MRYYLANVLDEERTCYPDGVFPPGETPEVIEFGITVVDLAARRIVDTRSITVVPTLSQVSDYCTNLTGWTYDKLLETGIPFADACRIIVDEFDGLNRLLVVDSVSDIIALQNQCALTNVPMPFGPHRLDVSMLFSLLTNRRKRIGNAKLLSLLGLQPEPIRHRADSDSRGTARALLAVLDKASFKA